MKVAPDNKIATLLYCNIRLGLLHAAEGLASSSGSAPTSPATRRRRLRFSAGCAAGRAFSSYSGTGGRPTLPLFIGDRTAALGVSPYTKGRHGRHCRRGLSTSFRFSLSQEPA